ncbi:class I SAM-dependent methyltransferase [Bacteroidota bacterium]
MTHEYPKNFARFYDLIYHKLRDGVDNEFFLNEIGNTPGKILEIGVGTGRFFLDAINQGADIYGMDISESMIKILQGKLDENQFKRISIQNIVEFEYDFQFDLIIAPFRVFMHLIEKADQLEALNNVYRHLKPNGKFIYDTFVPDMKQLLNGLDMHTDFEGEYEPGKVLRRIVSTKPDLINQIIEVNFKLEWEEEEGLKHEYWTLPLRFFFRYELEHLIERTAFEKYTILGDYQGNELNEKSKEFIVVCHKKTSKSHETN